MIEAFNIIITRSQLQSKTTAGLFHAAQWQKVKSGLQAFVDAQLSLAGRTGVPCISEPVHTERDETASQNKPGGRWEQTSGAAQPHGRADWEAGLPAEQEAGTEEVSE